MKRKVLINVHMINFSFFVCVRFVPRDESYTPKYQFVVELKLNATQIFLNFLQSNLVTFSKKSIVLINL